MNPRPSLWSAASQTQQSRKRHDDLRRHARLARLLRCRSRCVRRARRCRHSINLTRILEYRHLPSLKVEALLALLSVLVVSTFALVPAQSTRAYATEIGGAGIVIWAIQTIALIRTWKDAHPRAKSTARILTNQLPPLPFVIGGVLLALEATSASPCHLLGRPRNTTLIRRRYFWRVGTTNRNPTMNETKN